MNAFVHVLSQQFFDERHCSVVSLCFTCLDKPWELEQNLHCSLHARRWGVSACVILLQIKATHDS